MANDLPPTRFRLQQGVKLVSSKRADMPAVSTGTAGGHRAYRPIDGTIHGHAGNAKFARRTHISFVPIFFWGEGKRKSNFLTSFLFPRSKFPNFQKRKISRNSEEEGEDFM